MYKFNSSMGNNPAFHWPLQYFHGAERMNPVGVTEKYELFMNNFIIVLGRNKLAFNFTNRCRFVLCFSWTNILNATFCFWVTKIDVPSSPPANTESELIVSVPTAEQRHWSIQDRKAVAFMTQVCTSGVASGGKTHSVYVRGKSSTWGTEISSCY